MLYDNNAIFCVSAASVFPTASKYTWDSVLQSYKTGTITKDSRVFGKPCNYRHGYNHFEVCCRKKCVHMIDRQHEGCKDDNQDYEEYRHDEDERANTSRTAWAFLYTIRQNEDFIENIHGNVSKKP